MNEELGVEDVLHKLFEDELFEVEDECWSMDSRCGEFSFCGECRFSMSRGSLL